MKIPSNQYVLFREEQQYRQTWFWVLLTFSGAASIIPLVVLLRQGDLPLQEGMLGLAAILLIMLLNFAAFYFTRFDTVVTSEGIYYRWWPFFPAYSFISSADIALASYKRWPFMKWGFLKRKGFGRCHTVDGDKGLKIELRNGKSLYIGTQQLLSFEQAVHQMLRKKTPQHA